MNCPSRWMDPGFQREHDRTSFSSVTFKDVIIREAAFVPGRAGVKGKFSTALER